MVASAPRGTLTAVARASVRGLRREWPGLLVTSVGALVALLWIAALGGIDSHLLSVPFAFGLLVNTALLGGAATAGLLAARGGKVGLTTLQQAFWPPSRWFGNIVVGGVLALLIGVGLVCLVVPGVYLLLRTGFSFIFVSEEGRGPMDAIQSSWRLTRGSELRLLGLLAVSVVVLGLGVLCFVVGVVPALALVAVGWGAVFDLLREEQGSGGRGGDARSR